MATRAFPAVLPSVALLAGAALGLRCTVLPVVPSIAVGVLGCGLRPPRRGAVIGLAAGLLAAGLQGDPGLADRVRPDRPATVEGRVSGHPRWNGDTWSVPLAVSRLGPPGRSEAADDELWLSVPGRGAPPSLGARLRVRGYPVRSPGFANALPVAPGPWRLSLKSRRLLEVVEEPAAVADLATRLRGRVERGWREAASGGGAATASASADGRAPLPEGGAGLALVRALVVGDTAGVPGAWRRGLRRSGLAHLLAVSGLHVGLVAATALLLVLPLPVRWRVPWVLAAVVLYLLVAGPRPALLRASLMGLLAAVALLLRRPALGGNALAVVAAALVAARPELVDDLGFRLTVSATAGLIFVGPPLARWVRAGVDAALRPLTDDGHRPHPLALLLRALRALAAPLTASVGAQVGSAPFALPAFHLLALTAPLTNLVAVPWTALFLGVAVAWTGLALAAPGAAGALLPLLDLAAAPFGWPAEGSPSAWGTVAVAAPAWACAPAAVALAVWAQRPRRRLALLAVPLLLAPACRGTGPGHPHASRDGVEMAVLDVGQGDAVLLRDGRRAVLVDGGGWRRGDLGGRVLLPALLGEGVDRLHAVVLTHPDRDHCGGLVDLASYLPVAEVWTAPGWEAEGCGAELVAAVVGERPSRLHRLSAGDETRLGAWRPPGRPPPRGEGGPGALLRRAARRHDRSLVLRAEALGRRALLTGDVEVAAERAIRRRARLAGRRGELATDFLKVAHHGSRTSTGPLFLRSTAPRLAVIPVGARNPYHHPAPEVVERLRRSGARVLRTDVHGMVHLAWRGPRGLRLSTGRAARAPARSPP